MYQAYWGLKQSPFTAAAGRLVLEESPLHGEALARLAFLVDNGSELGLVVGPSGCGKSLVLGEFVRRQQALGAAVASVQGPGLGPKDLLVEIASRWGLAPSEAADLGQLWRMVSDRLSELHLEQVPAVLVLDDGDAAQEETLAVVERILQIPDVQRTVVLAAADRSVFRLGPRLLGRAELRIELTLWDEEETRAYLKTTLSRAGRQQPAFADRAVARLFQLSGGAPRRVNQLAQLALVAGAGQNLAQVDEQTILAVYEELSAAR